MDAFRPCARGIASVASIGSAIEITLGLVFVVAATSKVINATDATALTEFLIPTGGKELLLSCSFPSSGPRASP
jgi:hypothetical protein